MKCLIWLLVLWHTASLAVNGQQVVDSLIAVVGGDIVTQNDWDEQLHYEALIDGRPATAIAHSPVSLQRIIDRTLILEQLQELNFRRATPEQVNEQIAAIRKQLPVSIAGSDADWAKTLSAYGLPEDDFRQLVLDQTDVLRFIDLRFRVNLHISPFDIENYYKQTFLPEFKRSEPAQGAPALLAVQDRIRSILMEQRVDESLNSFVQGLRAQSTIRILAQSPTTGAITK